MKTPLFVFEMANNHMGDTPHGIELIRAIRAAVEGFPFEFAFKLQYRDLETFIHSSFKGRKDVAYVKRFEETRLSPAQFETLLSEMKTCGFRTICTPFDENSVDMIEKQGIEYIKIASCSFTDWPLLERIARSNKPIIASTAGATQEEIDNVVSFMSHRSKDFSILHCVAEYPTPSEKLQLNQLDFIKNRYAGLRFGFSTHELPSETDPVMLAIAKGARIFEKHVGLPSDKYKLNSYSATPDQIRAWLAAAMRAIRICGETSPEQASEQASEPGRYTPSAEERANLMSLRRGIFSARDIPEGKVLNAEDVEFAFPPAAGQLTASDWSKYMRFVAKKNIRKGLPIPLESLSATNLRELVLLAVQKVNQLLKQANVVVPNRAELEISHHYGMERFFEFGLTMITIVNREYCKKLIIMLPGQSHPEQFHKEKEETFLLLHGEMTIWMDGVEQNARPGDVITVKREVKHKFSTREGVVFEEISSSHLADDSYYTDPAIAENMNRKTSLAHWMTHGG